MEAEDLARRLVDLIAAIPHPVVAFSGGVDSSVVAMAAFTARPRDAIAVTGISPSVSRVEREAARETAESIGIRHLELPTRELDNPAYVANGPDRCYHCKSELYGTILTTIHEIHGAADGAVVLSGANADDWGDHRPGLAAATEAGVRHPLTELRVGKRGVRELARYWRLEVWDKPASPCLASRIAYGVEVTPRRLEMVEQAESVLRELGFRAFRVRCHADDLARIEVPLESLPKLCRAAIRTTIVARFHQAGFRSITLDLEGFRSGNLNAWIGVEELSRWRDRTPPVSS